MKNVFFILLVFAYVPIFAQHDHHNTKTDSTAKPKSPRAVAMEMVGNNHVHIDYGSPSVRGRNIWNGLVAFGQVWVTGAHSATWIEFSEDVKINGQLVPKGKYGFFTIPGKKEWILILNQNWNMHLADDYDEQLDIIRLTVKPEKNKKITEALTYEVQALTDRKGRISVTWEFLSVSFDFENQ
jgi:hypothetical protein